MWPFRNSYWICYFGILVITITIHCYCYQHKADNVDNEEVSKYVSISDTEEVLRNLNVISVVPLRQTKIDVIRKENPSFAFLDSETYTRVQNVVRQ